MRFRRRGVKFAMERFALRPRPCAVGCLPLLLLCMVACGCQPAVRVHLVSRKALESAEPITPEAVRRYRLRDVAALTPLYQPLGQRVGLLLIRNREEWRTFAAATGATGPMPDFRAGPLVGLVTLCGTPLGEEWPLVIEAVRLFDQAGMIEAKFNGGCFHCDGAAQATIAQVPDLKAVLLVRIDGVSFYPPGAR